MAAIAGAPGEAGVARVAARAVTRSVVEAPIGAPWLGMARMDAGLGGGTARRDESIRVAALAGSLRRGSYNRALLRAAMALQPEGMLIAEVPIGDLPLFDQDLESPNQPESVRAFVAEVARADAVLFVTPEYNYSISGVLKNAIDWGSWPTGQGALQGKVAAIMGASSGPVGTRRAQLHLRQILTYLDVKAVNKPEVVVVHAGEKLDADGVLVDEAVRDLIRQLLTNLLEWTRRFTMPV